MRNVLIYFDTAARREILDRVHIVLRPGGVLFLGGSETTMLLTEAFERVPFGEHSYYRPI